MGVPWSASSPPSSAPTRRLQPPHGRRRAGDRPRHHRVPRGHRGQRRPAGRPGGRRPRRQRARRVLERRGRRPVRRGRPARAAVPQRPAAGGPPDAVPDRHQPGRRDRRGGADLRRRREHRGAPGGPGRRGRRLPVGHRLRPGRGKAAPGLRLPGRAHRQEHRAPGARLSRSPRPGGADTRCRRSGRSVAPAARARECDRGPSPSRCCWARAARALASLGPPQSVGSPPARQAVGGRAAVREPEPGPRAGLLQRRRHRGSHHRALEGLGAVRHRAELRLHLQGQTGEDPRRGPRARACATSWKAASSAPATACASPPSSWTPRRAITSGPSATTWRWRDIFALQDEVTQQDRQGPRRPAHRGRAGRASVTRRPSIMEAYDLVLRGQEERKRTTREGRRPRRAGCS